MLGQAVVNGGNPQDILSNRYSEAGVQTTECKNSGILYELQRLEQVAQELSVVIDGIAQKAEPFLQPTLPQPTGGCADSKVDDCSEIESRIKATTLYMLNLQWQLQSLHQRIAV